MILLTVEALRGAARASGCRGVIVSAMIRRPPDRPSFASAALIAAFGGVLCALAWGLGGRAATEAGEGGGARPARCGDGALPPSAEDVGDPGPDGVSVDDSWGPLGP